MTSIHQRTRLEARKLAPTRDCARPLALAVWLATWVFGVGASHAQSKSRPEPPLLLGGPLENERAEALVDPALPTGALRWFTPRPQVGGTRCSVQRPVCVHGGDSHLRMRALLELEGAYDQLVYGARLPAPHPDDLAGGGDELDWYLERPASASNVDWFLETSDEDEALEVHLEPLPTRGFDRAAAFCVGHASDLTRSATTCVAEASSAARSPALGPAQRRAYAAHVGWSVRPPTAEDEAAIFRVQHAPERGVLGRRLDALSPGQGIFFEYLDRLGDLRAPLVTSTLALALAATRTPAGALRWRAEPDVADVVRGTFHEDRRRVARFWDELASARFLADRRDGWLGWPGTFATVRRAWSIKSSSLPRNLVLPRPLVPTGSAYVVVEMDHTRNILALRATCEGPVSWVWSVLRFDAEGQEQARLHIPFQERRPITEQRIAGLDQTRRLVLVGTNLGGVDLAHPFDPDHTPSEPHGCTVYLTADVL